MKPFRKGGTQNLARWTLGDRVTSVSELKVGDIVLNDSLQFDAHNLCRITRFDGFLNPPRDLCYAIFVDPTDTAKLRVGGDREFVIWGWELTGERNVFYRVTPKLETAPDPIITPVPPPTAFVLAA